MLDRAFCEFLEYEICKAFKYSDNDQIKGFWCDGVLLNQSERYYSPEVVQHNKQVLLKAFIGKDGQSEYELILKFGDKALSRYKRSLDIIDCVPKPNNQNWLEINIKEKIIEIQLD